MDRLPNVREKSNQILTMVAVVLLLLAWDSVLQVSLRRDFRRGELYDGMLKVAGKWIPEGETVGSFQSGATQYYLRKCRVVNLDGVVNPQALKALRERRAAQYLRDNGIDWLLELDWVIHALYVRNAGEPEPLSAWELVDRQGEIVLYRRRGME